MYKVEIRDSRRDVHNTLFLSRIIAQKVGECRKFAYAAVLWWHLLVASFEINDMNGAHGGGSQPFHAARERRRREQTLWVNKTALSYIYSCGDFAFNNRSEGTGH